MENPATLVTADTVTAALFAEHQAIDLGIEQCLASINSPEPDIAALAEALELLRRHIYLEEEYLFPPIKAAGVVMPILVMLKEHAQMWHAMEQIDSMISTGNIGGLREASSELLALLEAHNAKEEPIIYPHTDTDLDETARAQLADLINNSELPAGWVCQDYHLV